ncbi:hypothetical protein [Actinoplanes palleronii]|uniref:Uncharacterized protein n=1 Tax=Actinoplanes palleronii TaxID=113570 RepID=A0ABQ4B2Y6_9ACTN|nr:hypothetical protein [Actinoplanes palleronii]GIE65025.1 hypothetical protein Apa02nite_011330 [Actinoplanes palleronii]
MRRVLFPAVIAVLTLAGCDGGAAPAGAPAPAVSPATSASAVPAAAVVALGDYGPKADAGVDIKRALATAKKSGHNTC